MLKGNQKLILLILTFIDGMRYELDYLISTRKTVEYFANYKVRFIAERNLAF